MFIAFDQIRAERREWDMDVTASTLGEVLAKALAKVPEEPLPEALNDRLRRLNEKDEAGYWRNYF